VVVPAAAPFVVPGQADVAVAAAPARAGQVVTAGVVLVPRVEPVVLVVRMRPVMTRVAPVPMRMPVARPVVVVVTAAVALMPAVTVPVPVAMVVGVPMLPPFVARHRRLLAAAPLRREAVRGRRRAAHGALDGGRGRGRRHVHNRGEHV
jgi:hypothetical protein